jgi:hypothetical protein
MCYCRSRRPGVPSPRGEGPAFSQKGAERGHFMATVDKLPFHLVARGEHEEVGRKQLGGGFIAVPVHESRGLAIRPLPAKGFDIGVNTFIARGYGGQTTETLAVPGESAAFDRITGSLLKSACQCIVYRIPPPSPMMLNVSTPRTVPCLGHRLIVEVNVRLQSEPRLRAKMPPDPLPVRSTFRISAYAPAHVVEP